MFTNDWFAGSELKRLLLNYTFPKRPNRILEIGSYEGASACFFSDILLDNEKSELTCVDPFDTGDKTSPVTNETKTLFMSNIAKSKNYGKIKVDEMFSSDFYAQNTKTYNFIYIDGSHLIEDITIDFNNCLKIIEDGGIIWMDDYNSSEAIRQHIDNLYMQNKDKLQIIHRGYQIAFVIRRN
jgi:predicted O-methyltransferase YrrM